MATCSLAAGAVPGNASFEQAQVGTRTLVGIAQLVPGRPAVDQRSGDGQLSRIVLAPRHLHRPQRSGSSMTPMNGLLDVAALRDRARFLLEDVLERRRKAGDIRAAADEPT